MFNVNNDKNGITSQNIWDQTALFNQLFLCNILNRRNDLGTPELRVAVAFMSKEQKDNVLVFLECNTRVSWVAKCCGVQSFENTCTLLDYLPTLGPSVGANSARIDHRFTNKVASSLLPKFKNYLGQSKDDFMLIEESKMKFEGTTEPKFKQLLLLLVALQLHCGSREKVLS